MPHSTAGSPRRKPRLPPFFHRKTFFHPGFAAMHAAAHSKASGLSPGISKVPSGSGVQTAHWQPGSFRCSLLESERTKHDLLHAGDALPAVNRRLVAGFHGTGGAVQLVEFGASLKAREDVEVEWLGKAVGYPRTGPGGIALNGERGLIRLREGYGQGDICGILLAARSCRNAAMSATLQLHGDLLTTFGASLIVGGLQIHWPGLSRHFCQPCPSLDWLGAKRGMRHQGPPAVCRGWSHSICR